MIKKSMAKRLKIQKKLKTFQLDYAWNGSVTIEAKNRDDAVDKLSAMSQEELLNNASYDLFDIQEVEYNE